MKIVILVGICIAIGAIAFLALRRKPPAVEMIDPKSISFSQLDITETFGDNLRLKADDWITTTALNTKVPDPIGAGLPSLSAPADVVYEVASKLSSIREQIPGLNDGVYCPVCHIANTQISRLKTPCLKCNRPLLKFGWE